jgi:cytochrome b561
MSGVRRRFTVPQRMLHWVMAVCILAMLFIGVGMVSSHAEISDARFDP